MSYSDIEAQAQALLQALATYDDEDVTRGDERVLDRGSPPYVVLKPGPFRREPGSVHRVKVATWAVHLELYTRHFGDGTEWTDLQTYRDEIMATFDKYPKLNNLDGVMEAEVKSGGEPWERKDAAGGGPHFLVQRLVLQVKERVAVSGGEYA